MKNEKFNEFRENLNLEKEKWYTLFDIDYISLSDGSGIYPNWRFTRFAFLDDSILIRHGLSTPYGARLSHKFAISSTQKLISFPYGPIISPVDIHENFRNPKEGDIIVATDPNGNIVSECLVEKIITGMNGSIITLVNPITLRNDVLLSFYDPKEFVESECIHSNILTGVYLKFKPNTTGKNHKKLGIYHEIVKAKHINEFALKLISKKTYKIK